ncbi:MAG: hypothetical protein Q9M92_15695 [Enterobacterales bacterium]|nr:hypothetical protein [Enterobacterales bacterium]
MRQFKKLGNKTLILSFCLLFAVNVGCQEIEPDDINAVNEALSQPKLEPIVIDKKLVENLLTTSQKLARVATNHPELSQYLQQTSASNETVLLQQMQQMKFYTEIETALKGSPFADLTQLLSVSKRLMAMMYYMETGKEAVSKNIVSMLALLTANYEQMSSNQLTQAQKQKLDDDFQYQQRKYKGLQAALKLLSDHDKRFALKNHRWLKQRLGR